MKTKLTEIFEGVELSEDIKTKIQEAFDAAVNESVDVKESEIDAKYKAITEEYSQYLVSEYEQVTKDYIQEEVIPAVSKYVDYAASEFVKENQLAVDTGLKVELAESFLKGIVGLSEQFNVQIPAQDVSEQIKSLEEKVASANKKLDSVLTEKKELEKTIIESKKEKVIRSVAKDLTETQIEKLKESVSEVEFIDESQYTEAVSKLKESFAPEKKDDKKVQITENKDQDKWLENLLGRL